MPERPASAWPPGDDGRDDAVEVDVGVDALEAEPARPRHGRGPCPGPRTRRPRGSRRAGSRGETAKVREPSVTRPRSAVGGVRPRRCRRVASSAAWSVCSAVCPPQPASVAVPASAPATVRKFLLVHALHVLGSFPHSFGALVTPFPDGGTGLPVSGRMPRPSPSEEFAPNDTRPTLDIMGLLNKIDMTTPASFSPGERDARIRSRKLWPCHERV